jgi:hypothetical protein
MHDLSRLIEQPVCLDDTLPAVQPEHQPTFCLVWVRLQLAIASLQSTFLFPLIAQLALED